MEHKTSTTIRCDHCRKTIKSTDDCYANDLASSERFCSEECAAQKELRDQEHRETQDDPNEKQHIIKTKSRWDIEE